jgi:hypothetical protein
MPVEAVLAAARLFLGDRITTNTALRDQHSHGEDAQPPVQPDAVAFIETTEGLAGCWRFVTPSTCRSCRGGRARRWRGM